MQHAKSEQKAISTMEARSSNLWTKNSTQHGPQVLHAYENE